jgi:TorA maturation chaperone TorD
MMTSASASLNLTMPIPHQTDWTPLLTGEALVCGLLARLLFEEPQRVWVQSLADEAVFDDIPFGTDQPDVAAGLRLLQHWSQTAQGGLSDEAYESLRLDYTRLFLGPGKLLAAPWESAQITEGRQLFQPQTLQVRQWYRRFGLEAERLYTEPDDHIGLEIAFLAHLAQRSLEASTQNDTALLNEMLAAQRDFLTAHPLQWVPQWCAQVEANAHTGFYRGVAQVIRGLMAELTTTFGIVVSAEAAR